MGKASRMKQDGDRRARIAAQREAERRTAQRKRIYWAGGSILVVAIVVIALVLVKLNSNSTPAASSNGPTGTALTAVTKQVTDVPASITEKVADGGVNKSLLLSAPNANALAAAAKNPGSYFATVTGTPLTSGGKPEVLYLGAEYCPYCAAQRWAMINALSRFGTFTGLTTTHSSTSDSPANVPTWTFYKSTYKSDYITFTPIEETGNTMDSSGNYPTLQTPTQAQTTLAQTYDPGGAIPFFDIGNQYVQVGNLQPLTPTLLTGKTWAAIGAAINDPSTDISKAVLGNANYMTAGICKVIDNKATAACTPAIQKLEADLAS